MRLRDFSDRNLTLVSSTINNEFINSKLACGNKGAVFVLFTFMLSRAGSLVEVAEQSTLVCLRVFMVLSGAYNYHDLLSMVSRFIIVSAWGICRAL